MGLSLSPISNLTGLGKSKGTPRRFYKERREGAFPLFTLSILQSRSFRESTSSANWLDGVIGHAAGYVAGRSLL